MSKEVDGIDGGEIESDPSRTLLEAIRWSYFGIACVVFILGSLNVWYFLIQQGKWRTYPLLLMYICGQVTLIFALARTSYPDQPSIDTKTFEYKVFYTL